MSNVKEATKPRPYHLPAPSEMRRLMRECLGYLKTCERDHHGTDFEGRRFAMEALTELSTDKWLVRALARAEEN